MVSGERVQPVIAAEPLACASGLCTLVPRANVLADVAAEEPVAEGCAEFARDGAAELNREIADAARGVENVGLRESLRRTGVEAGAAGAAVVGGEGFVGLKF